MTEPHRMKEMKHDMSLGNRIYGVLVVLLLSQLNHQYIALYIFFFANFVGLHFFYHRINTFSSGIMRYYRTCSRWSNVKWSLNDFTWSTQTHSTNASFSLMLAFCYTIEWYAKSIFIHKTTRRIKELLLLATAQTQ